VAEETGGSAGQRHGCEQDREGAGDGEESGIGAINPLYLLYFGSLILLLGGFDCGNSSQVAKV